MRHDTMTVRRHFHPGNRCDTIHLRSAFPPASWNPEKSHHALQGRHFRVSTHQNHRVSRKIEAKVADQLARFGWCGPASELPDPYRRAFAVQAVRCSKGWWGFLPGG